MTSFFPEIYPDELVFSVCSRYHERMGYHTSSGSGRDMFGAPFVRVAVDLPHRLGDLCKAMPFGHSYTPDRLLEQHTLYPLYASFVSPKHAARLRKGIIATRGSVHAFAGALTIKLRSQLLRYCIECASEDRSKWEETYWHRIHNVTGVEVCPKHDVFLIDSSVPIRRASSTDVFITAENAIPQNGPPPKRSTNATYGVLAKGLAWLLQQPNLSCERSVNANRYGRLLLEKGFATFTGKVRATKLENALREYYSPDLLAVLQSEVDRNNGWIMAMTQPAFKRSQPPYRHLLVLNLLGCTFADFFSLPGTPFKPFGQAPWPCLSRASQHFKKSVVGNCRVRMATDGTSRPLGIFKCTCGFVYSRLGPDKSIDDRFRFHRIRAYGPVWITKMKRLLFIDGRSRKETAFELGVSFRTIENVLAKLPESKALAAEKHKVLTATLKERRSQWCAAVKQHPNLSRNKIRKIAGNVVYDTLRRNDRKWLELHSPPRQPRGGSNRPRINWIERDRAFAAKAASTAFTIIAAPGRPVRASATLIARRLCGLEVLYSRPECLPMTKTAIATVAETVHDFAIRRLRWAADSYKSEGLTFSAGQLKARAALSYSVGKDPKVAAVINGLVRDCHNSITNQKLKLGTEASRSVASQI